MSYIYAMSDIHGCLDAFEYALSLVDFSGDNRLILLGDYVMDRMIMAFLIKSCSYKINMVVIR